MSRSSPRSSRCIWNISARWRRSPTPRRRSSSASSRAARRCSTATTRNTRGSPRAAKAAGVARIVSFGEHAQGRGAAAALRAAAGMLDRRGATSSASRRHLQARRAGPASRAQFARRAGGGVARRRRSRARRAGARQAASRRPAAARASTLDVPGGSALLIDESYNANPASMRAAHRAARPGAGRPARPPHRRARRHAGTGRAGRRAASRPGRADRSGQRSIWCSAPAR